MLPTPMPYHGLTDKQEAFCRHLVADAEENGTRAALGAGCGKASAAVTASKWLKLAKVQERIAQLRGAALLTAEGAAQHAAEEQKREVLEEAAARVITELKALAYSDVTELFTEAADGSLVVSDLKKLPPEVRCAIQSVKRRSRLLKNLAGTTEYAVEWEVKLWDKPKALDMLGKHHGLFKEVVETRDLTIERALDEAERVAREQEAAA